MKKKLSTILLILIFLVGMGLILYPTVSDYWNSLHSTKAISDYTQQVANLSNEEYDAMLEAARAYNQRLAASATKFTLTETQLQEYYSLLGDQRSVIAYINIPSINCTLPIYHGTDEAILSMGIGHLTGSSLPVGGESTHCVLSGHRGLPSARLFTDLDQMIVGDIFTIQTLDETLTYEVDQIRIVEPEDVSELEIVPGEDYCTLVTCTPYGVNTHRLLVRGRRIDNLTEAATVRVSADAVQIEPIVVAPFAAIPILMVMLFWVLYRPRRRYTKLSHKEDILS